MIIPPDDDDNNFAGPGAAHLSRRRRRRSRGWLWLILAALLAGGLITVVVRKQQHERQQREEWARKGQLAPSGGRWFAKRLELPVPQFRQGDPRWSRNQLGPSTTDTLGSAGCAVSAASMVLASYGIDTDPQRLNDFLTANGGFTERGWLVWEGAALLAQEKVRFVYEDDASYQLIDDNLERGNPVIVRLRYADSKITHFVVICGKEGYDYLIRDPGSGSARGIYPLKDFGSPIEALRYYEKLPGA